MSADSATFCPYKGLQPYTEADRAYFFGRERDARIVASNLMSAPLTILYGASGVGKSSVIEAGAVPHLQKKRRVAIVVFRSWQDAGFLSQLKSKVVQAASQSAGEEIRSGAALPFDEFLFQCTRALQGPVFVVLDQFEEYFLYHVPSQAEDSFDAQLARAVNRREVQANFLISLREDGMSKLDRFQGRIPNLLTNLLRLEHLNLSAASDAIRKPLDVYNQNKPDDLRVTIEATLVEALLEETQSGKVTFSQAGQGQGNATRRSDSEARIETPYLQLVMTRLWNEEARAGSRALRLETLGRLGGIQHIVRTHLDDAMSALPETEKEAAARIFHYLVTPSGAKIAHRVPDLAQYAKLSEDRLRPTLAKLSGPDVRILRPVAPPPDQPAALRYEIFHDVLAPAILDWRMRFAAAQEKAEAELVAEEQRRRLEEKARLVEEREQQARLSFSREVAAAAISNLGADPERSILLALEAVKITRSVDNVVAPEAEDALHKAVETSRVRVRLDRHTAGVWGVAFSHDGSLIATASADGTAKVCDASSGAELLTLGGHDKPVNGIAFSPDGRRLATASSDQTAKVWDVVSGRELLTIFGHKGRVNAVAFSPDGKRIATASADATTSVWDAFTGEGLFTLIGHTKPVNAVAFSPDGTLIVTAGADGATKVWDSGEAKLLRTLAGHTDWVTALAFSSDGVRMATASYDKSVRVWNVASGEQLLTFVAHTNWLTGVAFSPDGARIATAGYDSLARVFDASSGQRLFVLAGHEAEVMGVVFSPDGSRVATASADKTARVWNATPEQESLTISSHNARVSSVVFSPDGRRMASAGDDDLARVWNAETGAELMRIPAPKIVRVAFSPDGTRLLGALWDGNATVWDAATGEKVLTLTGHTKGVGCAVFSDDGERIATSSADETAKVWDAVTGREMFTLSGHKDWVNWVEFSPDGTRLATASDDETVKLWDGPTGQLLRSIHAHTNWVDSVAFSPDGKWLASSSHDTTARVWDILTGEMLRILYGHTHWVYHVTFSSDGTRIGTASKDGSARVWDSATGKLLLTLSGHTDEVGRISFSPDGRRIVTGSWDKTARVWDGVTGAELFLLCNQAQPIRAAIFSPDGRGRLYRIHLDDLIEIAESRVTRELTSEERHKYLHREESPVPSSKS